ncbi:MAG: hypothetical protein ACRD4Q_02565 [Candidatus Acidiferrales bacterium]
MKPTEAASNAAGVMEPSVLTGRLSEILLASVAALAGVGEVEAACRLAGQACVALRIADPAMAHRFDALLHRLTPTLKW